MDDQLQREEMHTFRHYRQQQNPAGNCSLSGVMKILPDFVHGLSEFSDSPSD